MERRRFLQFLGAGSVLAAVGVLGISSFDSSIKNMIQEDTKGMKIKEKDVDEFLSDAKKEMFWQQYDLTKRGFIVAHTWLGLEVLPYKIKYTQYRSQIVGAFLLSTDYFTNKMDPEREIQYTGFYNPYKRACASPFSNFYYPA